MNFLVEHDGEKVDLREMAVEARAAYISKMTAVEARVWVAQLIEEMAQVPRVKLPYVCRARSAATDPPQDCDWPTCGCDPNADKVIEAMSESGVMLSHPRALVTPQFEAFMKEVAEAYWPSLGFEHITCPTLVFEQATAPPMTPKDWSDAVEKRLEQYKVSGLLLPEGPNERMILERLDQGKLKPGETTDLLRKIAVGIDGLGVAGSTPAGTSTVAGSRMPEGEWGVGAQPQAVEDSRKSPQLFKEEADRVHGALHRAWTNVVGTEKYDKSHFKELLAAIEDFQLKVRVHVSTPPPPPPPPAAEPPDPGATRILELAMREAEQYGMIRGVESLREWLGGYLPTIHRMLGDFVASATEVRDAAEIVVNETAFATSVERAAMKLRLVLPRLSQDLGNASHFLRPRPPPTVYERLRKYVDGLHTSESEDARAIANRIEILIGTPRE